MRENLIEQTRATDRAMSVFAEPRQVLDQNVPVGEQAHQDELDLGALADHGALDLVEDLGRASFHIARRDRHLDRLQRVDDRTQLVPAAATATGSADGRLAIGADELPRLRSEQRPGALGLPVERDAVAREPGRRDLANDRTQDVVEVERGRLGEIERPRNRFELTEPLRPRRLSSGTGSARGSASATPRRTTTSTRAANTKR